MNSLAYIDSLIAGQKLSSIPVQTSELELLKAMVEQELTAKRASNIYHSTYAPRKGETEVAK